MAKHNIHPPQHLIHSVQQPTTALAAPVRAQRFTLPVDQLHPVIRIAHRAPGPLRIESRIIFDHELVLFTAGRCEFTLAGQRQSLAAGDLVLLRPFVPHSFHAHDPRCEHLAVHFDWSPDCPPPGRALDERRPYEVCLSHGLTIPTVTRLDAGDAVRGQMLKLIEDFAQGQPLRRVEARVRLERVLLSLIGRQARRPNRSATHRDQARLQRAVDLVHEKLAGDLSVDDMAAAADVSPSHFNRLFRQWTGQSPMAFVRSVRIEHARQLLADPTLSIKQIAGRTGFADPYHFSKAFRQVDGLSPSAYREAALAGRMRG